jgi:hypothetical protein
LSSLICRRWPAERRAVVYLASSMTSMPMVVRARQELHCLRGRAQIPQEIGSTATFWPG